MINTTTNLGGTATISIPGNWSLYTPRCPCCNRKAKPGFPFKYGWQYPVWTYPYQITGGSATYTGPELTVYNNNGGPVKTGGS